MHQTGFWWERSPVDVLVDYHAKLTERVRATVEAVFQEFRPQIEAWMKENAPWHDRTGNARAALHADVEKMQAAIRLIMAHGVSYARWLETAYQGQYSILRPALDYWGPLLMLEVRKRIR